MSDEQHPNRLIRAWRVVRHDAALRRRIHELDEALARKIGERGDEDPAQRGDEGRASARATDNGKPARLPEQ